MKNGVQSLIDGIMKRARSAPGDLADGVSGIRAKIDSLKAEREQVEKRPPPLAVAIARAEKWVDRRANAARNSLPSLGVFCGPDYEDQGYLPFEYMAAGYLAPLIKAALKEDLTSRYEAAGQDEISDEERREELRSIDRQLLDAELTEESLIRAAEMAGFALSRRADADPRAVLAMEEDLP